jgi:MFS family permease
MFVVGLIGAGLLGFLLVPHLGWQAMFYIGALPIFFFVFGESCTDAREEPLAGHFRSRLSVSVWVLWYWCFSTTYGLEA